MKVCIDPGHGMSNSTRNVYDTGSIHVENGVTFEEAAIALSYAFKLKDEFGSRGIDVFMTRDDKTDHTPVERRASMALTAGCEVFISLHLNHNDDHSAHGLEVLYRDSKSIDLAQKLQVALIDLTKMKDRDIKKRTDLAVLKFQGVAVLIELGFISNDSDREKLLNPQVQDAITKCIASTVIQHFE